MDEHEHRALLLRHSYKWRGELRSLTECAVLYAYDAGGEDTS